MKLQWQYASPWSRFFQPFGCTGLLLCVAVSAHAGEDWTCENPIPISVKGRVEYQLDTRLYSDNENSACVDSLATGPDIVLMCDFGCANGVVRWTADFDAVVYIRGGLEAALCEAPCRRSSTAGETWFDSNWHMEGGRVFCDLNYIVVDGLNGAAGTIKLDFEIDSSTPVLHQAWGQIKARFR